MKLMDRPKLLVAALSIGLLCVCPIAGAHVLKQDNGTSAVLHIAPYDAPTSGTPIRIEIEFSNTANNFSLNDYHVKLRLAENGQTVHDYTVLPAFFGTADEGLAIVTFPTANVYNFDLSGAPTAGGALPFSMQYEVRVTAGAGSTEGATQKGSQTEVLAIGGTILVVFAMIATRQIMAGKRYGKQPKEEQHV